MELGSRESRPAEGVDQALVVHPLVGTGLFGITEA